MKAMLVLPRVLWPTAWFAALLLAACAFVPSPPVGQSPPMASLPPVADLGKVRGPNVTIHAWRTITSLPTQTWSGPRTRLFTYVLVGDIGNGDVNAATRRAKQALNVLIKEVQAGQQIGEGQGGLTQQMLEQANQFCIPVSGPTLTKVTPTEYSLSLAAAYLNLFRFVFGTNQQLSSSLSGVGPFLIATRKPVGELLSAGAQGRWVIDTSSPVLVMDMTGRHPDAIPEYVNAFKVAVRHDVAVTAGLKPLRPTIASYLLTVNEAIPVVAEAYAGTRKQFQ